MGKNNQRVIALSVLLFATLSLSAYSWVSAYRGDSNQKEFNYQQREGLGLNKDGGKCSKCGSCEANKCAEQGCGDKAGGCGSESCGKAEGGCRMHQNK